MFTTKPSDDETKNESKMNFMTGMMVGTSVEFQHIIVDLIHEYRKKNISEISISVLEDALMQATIKNMSPEGLLGMMMQKGDVKCK